MVFMVRKYACDKTDMMSPDQRAYALRLRSEYLEDSLFMSGDALDKLYCKPGEMLRDEGGETVDQAGNALPAGHSIELLKIVDAD
jgi:hypothetical protein